MLDTYDFDGKVWLCHSFQGQCYDFTAFVCKNHLPTSVSLQTLMNDQQVPLHKDPNFILNK